MKREKVSDRSREAMQAVPRRWFLPEEVRAYAAEDRPLSLGFGQTNSQPTTVGRMLTHLDPQPGDRVLDVGSGSGWTAALLAHLVGRPELVLGVEIEPELVALAQQHLDGAGLGQVRVHRADPDVLGLPEHGPFDKILVSAQAPSLPQSLVDQLADGGRLVLPVASRMLVVDRDEHGEVSVRRLGSYSFVPLRWSGRD